MVDQRGASLATNAANPPLLAQREFSSTIFQTDVWERSSLVANNHHQNFHDFIK
jgi:hypothetical protein